MNENKCKFCDESDTQDWDITVADDLPAWTHLYRITENSEFAEFYSKRERAKIQIMACGDDEVCYVPKFCPECGRCLIDEEKSDD